MKLAASLRQLQATLRLQRKTAPKEILVDLDKQILDWIAESIATEPTADFLRGMLSVAAIPPAAFAALPTRDITLALVGLIDAEDAKPKLQIVQAIPDKMAFRTDL
jgi:hypothetical protein